MPYQTGSIITVQQAADQSPVKARKTPANPCGEQRSEYLFPAAYCEYLSADCTAPVVIEVEIHQTLPKVTTQRAL